MSKAIVIGYLAKVSAANVNASHTEGNVMVAKKVTLPDGSTVPRTFPGKLCGGCSATGWRSWGINYLSRSPR
jgi:hypothetical protein